MATRRLIGTALVLVLSAPAFQARAQGLTTYLESSGTEQKLRSNAGLSVQGDRLGMRADLALRGTQFDAPSHALQLRPNRSTEVVPSLRSAFTLAKNLDLETGVSFAEWNASSSTTFNTRLRYRKSLDAFFDELDGSLWRSPEGLTKQSLRLGFHEVLSDPGVLAPLTITGHAVYEATQGTAALAAASSSQHRVRIEARVAGFMPAFLGAEHAVGFRAEKAIGARPESASAFTYNPSWTPSSLTNLGLSLQLQRQTYSAAHDFAPSIDFAWRSKF